MISEEDSSKSKLLEQLKTSQEAPIHADNLAKKLEKSLSIIYGWDHTGDPNKSTRENIEGALSFLDEAESSLVNV